MNRPQCAGARQRVDRVVHPQRGEGSAVYENGPSVFVPDGGEPIAMRIRFGGVNQEGSWNRATDPDHGEVHLRVLASGESHHRAWHPVFGAGWLVWETARKPAFIRFEGDDGSVLRLAWNVVTVGTPDYARRLQRSKTRSPEMTPEERHWRTFELTDRSVFAFRDGPPETAPANEAPRAEEGQQSIPGLSGQVRP